MGKTPFKLNIAVHPSLIDAPWVEKLREKGHLVSVEPIGEWNLVLGPNCHYFNEAWGERELELSLKWARKEARGKT